MSWNTLMTQNMPNIFFDEVNKMRTANGVEPFVWNEEDAVYASKVKVGMHVQPDFDIYGITGVDENKETQDVQLVYGDDKVLYERSSLGCSDNKIHPV